MDVTNKGLFNFNNTYSELPGEFYSLTDPTKVQLPQIAIFNENLARELGLSFENTNGGDLAEILSGNKIPPGGQPLAQAYAGHQFGHFTMLGDGRAILLGEHITTDNRRFDVQLKGAGRTAYSRGGDGRATISSMLREYLLSEAIHSLGIPSTRSLAVVLTGEEVRREIAVPGAVLTRVTASHIRVGTFEFAAKFLGKEATQHLLHYTIRRHYPTILGQEKEAGFFLKEIMVRQIDLIVSWLRVGFIHGVMNTDNMSIAGETIDYGPCAFMNTYDPATVFSSIDHQGRYAFMNQPSIGQWNLAVLATTLLPLIHDDEQKAVEIAQEVLNLYTPLFRQKYREMLSMKIGFHFAKPDDLKLIDELLAWMKDKKADYTNTFNYLGGVEIPEKELYRDKDFQAWRQEWKQRLEKREGGMEMGMGLMRETNPVYIPRNHLVESALEAVTWEADYQKFNQLSEVLSKPYKYRKEYQQYQLPPPDGDVGYQTFCGT